MGFRFVRWLLMMFIFTFSSSHSHRGLIVIAVIGLMILNEWEWMEVVCWRMKMNLTIFSFFSFLQWWKQTRNEMKFQLHSFCFSFLQCLMIASNSRKTKLIVILSFWIVIWESVILIKLVEMIEISTAFAKHVLNLFCFLLLFDLRIVEKREMWKEVWNLLVRNNWWNTRKKERKVWYFAFVKLDETPSRLDWLNVWNWLQSNKQRKFNKTKQTTISTTAELGFSFLLLASERKAVFSSFYLNTNYPTFFECIFREQEHLKRENGNEMEKYLLLANQ